MLKLLRCSTERSALNKRHICQISVINDNHPRRKYSVTKSSVLNCQSLTRSVRAFSDITGIVTSPFEDVKIPTANVVEHVWKRSDEWIDKPVATCAVSGRSYTYGMMRMLINRCAQALVSHCGLQQGDVVGLLLPNIPEYIIVCHGAMQAGLTVTFVNPLYTPDEVRRQFQNAGVKLTVTIPQLLEVATTVGPTLSDYKGTICVGGEHDPDNNVLGLQPLLMGGHTASLSGISPKELALLPYSSGTTGLPKGVMLSHWNLVANLAQGTIDALSDEFSDNEQDRVLSVLPFFHIYGFNSIMNNAIYRGTHLITMPKFTPEDYIKALVQFKPTMLFVVPSLLLFLASHPAVKMEHLASVKAVTSGAAPATEGLMQKFREKLGRKEVNIRQGYGMTESSPVTLLMPRLTPRSKIGTVGVLLPNTEAKIVSLQTSEVMPTHKPGELWVRGPQVMVGYLNNEKATSETLDEEGWLHTGDVAYYDEDGYFYIVDRCKELIKVKGNQVSPTELENLLLELPGVADVAVVGVPDTLAGEVPRAFVVRREGAKLSEDDVASHVNPKVAHYKKLSGGVKFVQMIPRNPNGKILRNELKIIK